jgi:hypothetical protein
LCQLVDVSLLPAHNDFEDVVWYNKLNIYTSVLNYVLIA